MAATTPLKLLLLRKHAVFVVAILLTAQAIGASASMFRQRTDGNIEVYDHQSTFEDVDGGMTYCETCPVAECPECAGYVPNVDWFSYSSDLWLNMILSPDKKNVYMVNPMDSILYAFSRSLEDGSLSLVQNITSVVVDPDQLWKAGASSDIITHGGLVGSNDGRNVYISTLGNTEPDVMIFNRDTQTGLLTRIHTITGNITASTVGSRTSWLAISEDDAFVYLATGQPLSPICEEDGLHYTMWSRNPTASPSSHLSTRVRIPIAEPILSIVSGGNPTLRNVYFSGPDYVTCDDQIIESYETATIGGYVRRSAGRLDLLPDYGEVFVPSRCGNGQICPYGLLRISPDLKTVYSTPHDYTNLDSNRLLVFKRDVTDPTAPGALVQLQDLRVTGHSSRLVNYGSNKGPGVRDDTVRAPMIRDICVSNNYLFISLEYKHQLTPAMPAYMHELVVFQRNSATGEITFLQSIPKQLRISGLSCTDDNVYASDPYGIRIFDRRIDPPMRLNYSTPVAEYTRNVEIEPNLPRSIGDPILAYSVAPPLPDGLALDPETGSITGTPTGFQSAALYVVTGVNDGGSVLSVIEIAVKDVAPTCAYAPTSYTFDKDDAVFIPGPVTSAEVSFWTRPPGHILPLGLSLHPSDASIQGVALEPTVVSTSFTVYCGNSGGTVSTTITIMVNDNAPADLRYELEDADYVVGSKIRDNRAYHKAGTPTSYTVEPALPSGLTLHPMLGYISGTPQFVNPNVVTYTVTAANPSGSTNRELHVRVLPRTPFRVEYPDFVLQLTKGIPLAAQTPTAQGGIPTHFRVSPSLPAGLSLDAESGAIEGTPVALAAERGYIVTAENAGGESKVTLFLEVHDEAPHSLGYNVATLRWTIGEATSYVPTSLGGSVVYYTVTSDLPAGLALNPETGVVSGTPTVLWSLSSFHVIAHNSGGMESTVVFVEVVDVAPGAFSYGADNHIVVTAGVPVDAPFFPAFSGLNVEFSSHPALPEGLYMNSTTGAISGMAVRTSEQSVHLVEMTNSGGTADAYIFVTALPVAPANLTYENTTLLLVVDEPMKAVYPTVEGGPVDEFSIEPFLPFGLVLDPLTGRLSGNAEIRLDPSEFTITARNAGGAVSTTMIISLRFPTPINVMSLTMNENDVVLNVGEMMLDIFVVAVPLMPFGYVVPDEPFSLNTSVPGFIGGKTDDKETLKFDPVTGTISGTPTIVHERMPIEIIGYDMVARIYMTVLPDPPGLLYYVPSNNIVFTAGVNIPWNSTDIVTVRADVGENIASWAVYPPLGPYGLEISETTGSIYGFPENPVPETTFMVVAKNARGFTYREITITVIDRPLVGITLNRDLDYASSYFLNQTAGDTLEIPAPRFGAAGGTPDHFEIEPPLPEGLIFNPNTGAISGVIGNYSVTTTHVITAYNTANSISVQIVLPQNLFVNETLTQVTEQTLLLEEEDEAANSLAISALSIVFLMLALGVVFFALCRRKTYFTTEDDEFIYTEDEATFNKRLELLRGPSATGGRGASSSEWDLDPEGARGGTGGSGGGATGLGRGGTTAAAANRRDQLRKSGSKGGRGSGKGRGQGTTDGVEMATMTAGTLAGARPTKGNANANGRDTVADNDADDEDDYSDSYSDLESGEEDIGEEDNYVGRGASLQRFDEYEDEEEDLADYAEQSGDLRAEFAEFDDQLVALPASTTTGETGSTRRNNKKAKKKKKKKKKKSSKKAKGQVEDEAKPVSRPTFFMT